MQCFCKIKPLSNLNLLHYVVFTIVHQSAAVFAIASFSFVAFFLDEHLFDLLKSILTTKCSCSPVYVILVSCPLAFFLLRWFHSSFFTMSFYSFCILFVSLLSFLGWYSAAGTLYFILLVLSFRRYFSSLLAL